MAKSFYISTEVDTEELAYVLSGELDYSDLIEFVADLDLCVGDMDFTRRLIARLQELLVEDDESEYEPDDSLVPF